MGIHRDRQVRRGDNRRLKYYRICGQLAGIYCHEDACLLVRHYCFSSNPIDVGRRYGQQYHGLMALQIGVLVGFTQIIPEHQVQIMGVFKARVKVCFSRRPRTA